MKKSSSGNLEDIVGVFDDNSHEQASERLHSNHRPHEPIVAMEETLLLNLLSVVNQNLECRGCVTRCSAVEMPIPYRTRIRILYVSESKLLRILTSCNDLSITVIMPKKTPMEPSCAFLIQIEAGVPFRIFSK